MALTLSLRTRTPEQRAVLGLALGAVLIVGLRELPSPELRSLAAIGLGALLPGWLITRLAFANAAVGFLERCLLALGCGYALAELVTLGLFIVLPSISQQELLITFGLLDLTLFAAVLSRADRLEPRPGRLDRGLVLVLIVAGSLRLVNLGHSELQSDEAWVAFRAASLLQGQPDALLVHRKPPGELLLSALFQGASAGFTEQAGRLPFALAAVAAVLAFHQLGQRLFGSRAALIGSLLLAINGYWVAFGRMLQYPSVALLLETLVVLCLVRASRSRSLDRRYAAIGALLGCGALLTSLSALFLTPIAAYLLWPRRPGRRFASWSTLAIWATPLLVLLPLIVLAYGLAGPRTAAIDDLAGPTRYLGDRVGSGWFYLNFRGFAVTTNNYTSSLYLLATCLLGLTALLAALRDWSHGLARSSSLAAAALPLPGFPTLRQPLAPFLVGALAALLVWSPRRSREWKVAFLWLAIPLFTHLFLVRVPYTHWREIFPGLLLLVGASLAGAYARLPRAWLRWVALTTGLLFLLACGHYVYTVWIQPWPEYQVEFPEYRHPLDWFAQPAPPDGGVFGSAHLDGWKVVGELVASGQLPASYDTNETSYQAAWYIRRPRGCEATAGLFVLTGRDRGSRRTIRQASTLPGYALAGQVTVDGRPTLSLFVRRPWPERPKTYRAEAFGSRFDQDLASPWAPIGALYRSASASQDRCD